MSTKNIDNLLGIIINKKIIDDSLVEFSKSLDKKLKIFERNNILLLLIIIILIILLFLELKNSDNSLNKNKFQLTYNVRDMYKNREKQPNKKIVKNGNIHHFKDLRNPQYA